MNDRHSGWMQPIRAQNSAELHPAHPYKVENLMGVGPTRSRVVLKLFRIDTL